MLFLDDLAIQIKNSGLGVNYSNIILSILLYADDIMLFAESEKDLQSTLDIVFNWCQKWRLSINGKKNQVMHVRKPNVVNSNFNFNFGTNYGTQEFPIPSNNCILIEWTKTYKKWDTSP